MAQNLGDFLIPVLFGLVFMWGLYVYARMMTRTNLLLGQTLDRLREIDQPVPPIDEWTVMRLVCSRNNHGDNLIQRLKKQLRWTLIGGMLLFLGVGSAALILTAIIGRVFGR